MNFPRASLLAAFIGNVSGCALLFWGGTVDIYVRVEGTLESSLVDCSIRFISMRNSQVHGIQSINPGPFKTSFIYNVGEKLSDFTAQVSCANGPWQTVGPDDAFAHGSPVILGSIRPAS